MAEQKDCRYKPKNLVFSLIKTLISNFCLQIFLISIIYYFISVVPTTVFTSSKSVALQDQIIASAAGIGSAVGGSSPAERIQLKAEVNFEPINLNVRQDPIDDESDEGVVPPLEHKHFHIQDGNKATPCVEHQFIPSVSGIQHGNGELKRLSVVGGSDDEMYVSLQLGEQREPKRRKQ